jgi:hypothetical protein
MTLAYILKQGGGHTSSEDDREEALDDMIKSLTVLVTRLTLETRLANSL